MGKSDGTGCGDETRRTEREKKKDKSKQIDVKQASNDANEKNVHARDIQSIAARSTQALLLLLLFLFRCVFFFCLFCICYCCARLQSDFYRLVCVHFGSHVSGIV